MIVNFDRDQDYPRRKLVEYDDLHDEEDAKFVTTTWVLNEEDMKAAKSLVIPAPAAMFIVRSGMAQDAACEHYGVSSRMLRFRINATGAKIRVARAS